MAKQCKLTVICENSVAGTLGLIGEHGWSVYLEMGEIKIIFDTGQGLGFIHNAELLGIPLREVDGVVLSHGHFDHASGLGELLHHGGGKKLFCHPDCFQPRFSVRGKKVREVGMSFGQEQLKSLGADIQILYSEGFHL